MKSRKLKQTEDSDENRLIVSFCNNLRTVALHFTRFCQANHMSLHDFKDPLEVYVRWLAYDHDMYEKDDFEGIHTEKVSVNDLWKAKDSTTFWKSVNPYANLNLRWRCYFSEKARRRFVSSSADGRFQLTSKLLELASGRFALGSNCNIVKVGPCRGMVSFSTLVSGGLVMLWCTQVRRLPTILRGKVQQYHFDQHMYIIDFVKKETQAHGALTVYLREIQDDPDKWLLPGSMVDGNEWQEETTFSTSICTLYGRAEPLMFPPACPTLKETDSIVLKDGRWRTQAELVANEKPPPPLVETYLTQLNSKTLEKLADAESCKGLIRLLETIPNFRIRLTDQERDLIGTPGNVLAIGRSGTGKTTCALLRLFASEVLFKFRIQKQGMDTRLVNARFGAEDLDNNSGLHTVFATASPVLTNEVKRFYWRLNDHIREELKRRNEIRKRKQEEEKEEYDIIEDEEGELDLRRQESEEKDEIKLRSEVEVAVDEGEIEDEEAEAAVSTKHSMAFVTDQDFPLFSTIRRLVLMVDATQRSPFFSRNVDGAIIGMSAGSEWHNEMKGILMINKEYKKLQSDPNGDEDSSSDSSEEESDEEKQSESKEVIGPKTIKKLSFEIDYDYFVKHFYPKVAQKAVCSAIVLWTEIVAYIKGSAESHKHPGWYLPKHIYVGLGRKTSFINVDNKSLVWDLFIEYERWRFNLGAYDFQDVVNYQLYYLNLHGYQGNPIHYMMIDEVQDLTHATLLLLCKITEQTLFFSGDTAQTIAKGVGFRFCDLKSLFYHDSNMKAKPEVKQLTINFRSHGKILDLANSVVSLLEAMFPRTIDKLAKEKSTIDGPKPMILSNQSMEGLFLLLFGARNMQGQEASLLSRAPIEFGCDQVIIVRNQEDKERLPGVLKGALCLTVYESKGLEFDDVVLFDFFTRTEVPEVQWRILQQLVWTGEGEDILPTDFDAMETAPSSVHVNNPHFDDSKYSLLCTELKMLYVAITRPRKRLIIFDTETVYREYILQYWLKLKVVDELQIIANSDKIDIVNATSMEEIVDSIASSTSAEAWRTQGFRMMKHRFYDQAIKCFEYSHDEVYMRKAMCYSLANEAAEILSKSQQTIEMMRLGKQSVKPSDRKAAREAREISREKFIRAAIDFEALGMKKQSAKCFFSARENMKAAELFAACESWGQCAEAFSASGETMKAGEMFEKAGEYHRAIECYRSGRQWDLILDCIHRFSEAMTNGEKEKLIKRYIPLALEELMPRVVPVGDDDQLHLKRLEEEKQGERIEEESEEEDDEEDEENPEETAMEKKLVTDEMNDVEEAMKEEPVQKDEIESVASIDSSSVMNMSSSIDSSVVLISAVPINQSTNPFAASTNPFAASTNPFDAVESVLPSDTVLSDSASSYSVISIESTGVIPDNASRLEILSNYDPDDEWLQVEAGSLADSLQSAVHKDGSVSFDYSIFDNSQAVALNLGGQLIKTRAEVFVEDDVMRRMLQYVSMFSEDVRKYLDNLRSADTLMQKENVQVDWKVASMIDLDDVDIQLIMTVLDTLEYFQLYKLCLVVCNRYSLSDRLGRYVTSLAHKYSSLPDMLTIMNEKSITIQKEKAVISYTAVHNVLEMIHPEVLSPKSPMGEKSLGINCFQSLLLLGYWKKCVYLLDKGNALAITATFADYKNYKNLLLMENADEGHNTCFKWVPANHSPDMAIMAIDEATWMMNHVYPITIRVHHVEGNIELPVFPVYAEFNEAFWRFVKARNPDTTASMKRHLVAASLLISTIAHQTNFHSPSIATRIHDCFSFLCLSLFASKSLPPVKELLVSLSCEHFDLLLQAISACEVILSLRKNPPGFSSYHMSMIYALFAPLGMREIRESEVTRCLPLGTHLIVNRYTGLNITQKDRCYPIEMEGDFFMCPIEIASTTLALEYVKIASDISKGRYRHWESHSEESKFQFDLIEDLTPIELTVKTAACLFGECSYISEMQSRYPAVFPNALKGVKPDMVENNEETEYESLQRELGNILALGDGDKKSMQFLRGKHAQHISELERKIASLKGKPTTIETSHFTKMFEVITEAMEWILDFPPVLTATARNYLLTYTQSYIKTIRYESESDRTQKMISSYRIFSLCRSEILLLDIIRIKAKPIIVKMNFGGVETETKHVKFSSRFLEDLAWLDIQVYFRTGDWAEAGNTLLRYLDCQSPHLDKSLRMGILEKAALFGIVAHCDRAFLPEYYVNKIGQYIGKIRTCKTDCNLMLTSVFSWLSSMTGDISQAYSLRAEGYHQQHFAKAAITIIVAILINIENPHAKLLMAFESLRATLCRHLGGIPDPFLKKLLNITKTKDIVAFRNEVNKMKSHFLLSNFVQLDCTKSISRGELDRVLDAALVSETREKSLISVLDSSLYRLALVKKMKHGKLRVKFPTQVVDYTERVSLTRVSTLLSSPAKESLLNTWRNSRAAMRLYQTISKTWCILLDYNQRSTGFTNVLDRHHVLYQLFYVAGVFTNMQNSIAESAVSGDVSKLIKFANDANEELEDRFKAFIDWTKVVSSNKKLDETSKRKKKWDARWKMRLEHKQEDSGKKKQIYLQKRARRLKHAGRS